MLQNIFFILRVIAFELIGLESLEHYTTRLITNIFFFLSILLF